jgi:hypothetical protein
LWTILKDDKNQGAMGPLLPTTASLLGCRLPSESLMILDRGASATAEKTHSESPEDYTAVSIPAAWRIPDGDWN